MGKTFAGQDAARQHGIKTCCVSVWTISTYGLMDKLSAGQVRARWIDFPLAGRISPRIDAQHAVQRADACRIAIAARAKKLLMPVRLESRTSCACTPSSRKARAFAAGTEESAGLFAALKASPHDDRPAGKMCLPMWSSPCHIDGYGG